MATIFFIQANGVQKAVQGVIGRTLMDAAVRHNVAGIDAECGGSCTCGTCHVVVEGEWAGRLADRSGDEEATLDYAPGVQANSRLACQIVVSEALDGLVVRVP